MYSGVLVGLGNPGPEYAHTRHNCGFDTLDRLLALAEKEGRVRTLSGAKFSCALWHVNCPLIKGDWLCAKPLTFMNESGRSVQPLLAWHKLQPETLIVLHDELDIPVGELRFKFGGGNAGHNGLKSITQCLGTPNFYRLRIGIGKPSQKRAVIDWVLGRPTDTENDILATAQEKALLVLERFAQHGLEAAVSFARAHKSQDAYPPSALPTHETLFKRKKVCQKSLRNFLAPQSIPIDRGPFDGRLSCSARLNTRVDQAHLHPYARPSFFCRSIFCTQACVRSSTRTLSAMHPVHSPGSTNFS